ncbi:MAG: trypsin-like peptidase domain-containing protein [Acidimicrobiia bacterium]
MVFDPSLDVAVLRVARAPAPALTLLDRRAERGTTAAVLGYPEGGPFAAEPAVILDHYDAVGRDIYSGKVIPRSVYELRAQVLPGNSGGPLVRPDGTVVGVLFSRAVLQDGIGYALASDEVAKRVDAARRRPGISIQTGPCVA